MKTILILITLCVLYNKTIVAQDVSKIIGTYSIQEIWTSEYVPSYSDTFYYDINIKPSSIDSFDIQYYLPYYLSDTVRAILLNDSTFHFYNQCVYSDLGDGEIYFSCISAGDGYIYGDSIKIDFGLGGSWAQFDCTSKGIRKNGTGIIKQNFRESELLLYPNPVKDILYLDLQGSDISTKNLIVKVFNINGVLVQQSTVEGLNKTSINISKLNAGIYFIELRKNNKTEYSGKFIKK